MTVSFVCKINSKGQNTGKTEGQCYVSSPWLPMALTDVSSQGSEGRCRVTLYHVIITRDSHRRAECFLETERGQWWLRNEQGEQERRTCDSNEGKGGKRTVWTGVTVFVNSLRKSTAKSGMNEEVTQCKRVADANRIAAIPLRVLSQRRASPPKFVRLEPFTTASRKKKGRGGI